MPEYEKRKFFTITELVAFALCPYKYYLSAGLGLRTREQQIALEYGVCHHKAIPFALTEGPAKGFQVFREAWEKTGLEDLQDPKRNLRCALRLIEIFARNHKPGIYTIQKPPSPTYAIKGEVSPWEIPFAIDIGLDIPLIGRVDGLCTHNSIGKPFILEYKTTSEMGTRFFEAFEIHCQLWGYTLAAQEVLNLELPGAILDALFVSTVKPNSIAKPYFIGEYHKKMFLSWARQTGAEILACEKTGFWPQRISSCNQIQAHGLPGYNCRFLPCCQVPDPSSQFFLYREERHIPFEMEDQK